VASIATVSEPLALTALGTSASTFGSAPGVPAADDEPVPADVAGAVLELLELLEHPAATRVVITAAVSVAAAAFPGRRRVAGLVSPVRMFFT
jgi:hypothetical protein